MRYSAAVITVSDKGARGERVDTSGPALCAILEENGYAVEHTSIVPDERELIRQELIKCADEKAYLWCLPQEGPVFLPGISLLKPRRI